MIYRKLGNTDLEISAIVYGAWAIGGWMWGGADEAEGVKSIKKAFDLGVTTIDTAPVYGMGHSEVLVGRACAGKRDKVQICSKYGLKWDGKEKGSFYFDTQDNHGNPIKLYKYAGKESVIEECENSLRRLKTDYIDLYQIHWPDKTTPVTETLEAIEILIKQGKIRYAGVCNFDVNQFKEANTFMPLASNQVPYSMVNLDIEDEIVPLCKENNIGILAYSPLQRGLLTGKINEDYTFSEGDHRIDNPYFSKSNVQIINKFLNNIKSIANNHNCTLSQLVLSWTIHQPGITCALAGARNVAQVEDNVKAADIHITEEDISFINEKLNEVKLDL